VSDDQPGRPSDAEVEALARSVVSMLVRRDAEALLGAVHPDYEFRSRLASVEGRVYQGTNGFREYLRDLDEGFTDILWKLEGVIGMPADKAIVSFRMHARGRESGVPIDFSTHQVWTFRDGLVWHNDVYRSMEEALAASRSASPGSDA
jgi:ketosteroid isomerase-like protein